MTYKQLINRLAEIETSQRWEADTIDAAIKEIKRLKKKVKKWKMLYLTSTER